MLNRLIIISLFVAFSFNVAAEDFSTPKGRVKATVNEVISILKDKKGDRDTRWKQIAKVINDAFDFRSMSQSVLSTNWRKASLEERERFTEFFSQYIEETYRSKIEAYTDQKVHYGDETIKGNRAVVETLIITSSTQIPVNFKLKNNDGEWYAYDVIIEGVSLVSNYRSTFATIVKNEGMDGLLSNIQSRIDKYKAEQAKKDAEGEASTGEAASEAEETTEAS